jgi:hypothetical protein
MMNMATAWRLMPQLKRPLQVALQEGSIVLALARAIEADYEIQH